MSICTFICLIINIKMVMMMVVMIYWSCWYASVVVCTSMVTILLTWQFLKPVGRIIVWTFRSMQRKGTRIYGMIRTIYAI